VILGVDHVAVSVDSLDRERRALEQLGFRSRFTDIGIPNVESKSLLLRQRNPLHDLAVFDGIEGTALELTVHRTPRRVGTNMGFVPLLKLQTSVLQGLEAVKEPPEDIAAAIEAAFGIQSVRLFRSPALDAPLWVVEGDAPALLSCIRLVKDLSEGAKFFGDGLGIKPKNRSTSGPRPWVRFDIGSQIQRWRSSILLCEKRDDSEVARQWLDDAGYPCLALLSTDLTSDVARLKANGARDETADFELVVNGKTFLFSIVVGPGGEIVELMQLRRN
jgi:hypothetical protein